MTIRQRPYADQVERETIPIMGYGPDGYVAALGGLRRLLQERGAAEVIEGARALAPGAACRWWCCPMSRPRWRHCGQPADDPRDQGDLRCSEIKLNRSGLEPYFDAVYVNDEKDAGVYRRIAAERNLSIPGWSATAPSRHQPAIEAGLGISWCHTIIPDRRDSGPRPDLVVTLSALPISCRSLASNSPSL